MIEDISISSGPDDPQQTEVLSAEGGVVIEAAYITKSGIDYDVRNFMVSFVLYEDIFSNFLTANVTLVDAASLITDIKPYGSEFFTISFRTRQSSTTITKSFSITALVERGPSSTDREQAYTFKLTSGENVVNNNVAISEKLSGRTDMIVERLYEEYIRFPRIVRGENTIGNTPMIITGGPHRSSVSFIPPFWTPSKCINWIANGTRGSKGEAPNYLFFETNKSFFFASIEDMIRIQRDENKIFASYIFSPSRHTVQELSQYTYQFPEISKGYSIVRKISAFDMFDIMQGQDRGFYGSTLQTVDLFFKEQRRFIYDHSAEYNKFNHIEDYTLSGGKISSGARKNTRPFGPGIFNGSESKRILRVKQYQSQPERNDIEYQAWLQSRNSLLSQFSQMKIVIEVAGRSDVEVGKLVNFLYPKMKSSGRFEIDPHVSGLYMITAIKHGVTREEYSMTLELTKDSMMESIS